MKANRWGQVAYMLYKGGPMDEEPIDNNLTEEPLHVVLGSHAVPRGVETALFEMEIGEERELVLTPEQAYGHYDKRGIQWRARAMIDKGESLKVGDAITCTHSHNSSTLPGRVVDASEDMVQIDVNHPFAGKTVSYWIKLVDLEDRKPTKKSMA
jgi:FKBP-type peptidyl-prolyl cis-trans isomerase 2